ncbi:hypothetical protein IW261DRAFT_1483685 [Armillaria novae-zelandiae]|uniref:Uncharacterized protein n=1 Tax=Armillaria novae-zelandiae TaxID=153914 RepID=A0AA39P733_9AGAR|nr:hypothetical protein IW261DRAFT_1483685 [Armillaria novae-zelandiae]
MSSQNIPELHPATVASFLQYLIPPVQLPPHLISPALRQRHHFLQIDPHDSLADYLTWPFPRPAPLTLISRYAYTGDQESSYAHAHVRPSPVRLVFTWDPNDAAWKYHNAGLMPFPQSSAQRVADIATHDKEEAAYWDATMRLVHDSHAHTEDAYWAQYATGLATSTVPSPVPEKRRPATHHEPTVVHVPSHAQDLSDRLLALSSRLESLPPISDVESWLHADNETALRDSIRGLYMLWRSSNTHWKEPATDEHFLSIVRDAIQDI